MEAPLLYSLMDFPLPGLVTFRGRGKSSVHSSYVTSKSIEKKATKA